MTKEDITFLASLGLKKVEAQVYLALLIGGQASIRQVALRADVNRGTTYDALKSLEERGLVGSNRKGERQRFYAESPEQINELIREKKRAITQVQAAAESVVPRLLAHTEQRAGEPVVRFYEDDDGVVTILRDVLSTVSKLKKKEYFVYSSRPLRQYIYKRFPSFTKRRIEAGISVRALAVGAGGDPEELAERKWLPEPATDEQLSSYTIIYGSKMALISVSPDDTPYGVIIDEPGVAAMQKHLFLQLWNK